MGPIIIFDKSAFQSLSSEEHLYVGMYFLQNLTPILPFELLGDLAKRHRKGRVAEHEVKTLARKFMGSGPAVNVDYREVCVANLMGHEVSMRGQILASGARTVETPRVGRGIIIDLTPINEALMRWQDGDFSDVEHLLSRVWRRAAQSMSMNGLRDRLMALHVILPSAQSIGEAVEIADALMGRQSLQQVWLEFLIGEFQPSSAVETAIRRRWALEGDGFLAHFAPYAAFCLRALLLLVVADRDRLVKRLPTNLIDLQYLYYLPFCMVFCSDDKLHETLAPHLMRDDQSFVSGRDLKAGIRRLIEERAGMSEEQRRELGSYPSYADGCAVTMLWKKHCGPPPPSGSPEVEMTEAQKEKLMEIVGEFMDQADKEKET